MEISSFFSLIQASVFIDEMVSYKDVGEGKVSIDYIAKVTPEYSYENIKSLANELNLDIENFYLNTNSPIGMLCYYKDAVYYRFLSLNPEDIRVAKPGLSIKLMHKQAENHLSSGNYKSLFTFMDKPIILYYYLKHFDEIPEKQRYDIFIKIYSRIEYGFEHITLELIEKLKKYRTQSHRRKIASQVSSYVDSDGYIKIYRGESTLSNNYQEAFSWTLEPSVAMYFALRFNEPLNVYTAKVKVKDIIAYIDNRSEMEVIVLSKNLVSVEEYPLYTLEDFYDREPGFKEDMEKVLTTIDETLFESSDVHGLIHSENVATMATLLARELRIDECDKEILQLASKYHDIGRIHDYADTTHGRDSFRLVKESGLLEKFDESEIRIIEYIMTNHCIDDERAIPNAENYGFSKEDKDRAITLLKILKDADALDRVRISDLDSKYLRFNESKEMIYMAYELNELESVNF